MNPASILSSHNREQEVVACAKKAERERGGGAQGDLKQKLKRLTKKAKELTRYGQSERK